jgi:hypothetical protein
MSNHINEINEVNPVNVPVKETACKRTSVG